MGAWFEAKITKITKKTVANTVQSSNSQQTEIQTKEDKETNNNSVIATEDGDTEMKPDSQNSENDSVKSEANSSEGESKPKPLDDGELQDDGYVYHIYFEGYVLTVSNNLKCVQ